jgi:DNA-binding GntR family transcriptional regulator
VSIIADRSPLYLQVAQRIFDSIQSGKYAVEKKLPTEQEFCALFDVSRITIRGAMRELEQRGVIVRQAGVGTIVKQTQSRYRYVHESSSIEDLLHFTQDMIFQLISQTPVIIDQTTAHKINANEGEAFLKIEGLRISAEVAICHSTHFIPAKFSKYAYDFDSHKGSLAHLLSSRMYLEIDKIDQTIEAINLDVDHAAILSVRENEAALSTWRKYYDVSGKLILASLSIFPKDRYSYSIQNKRQPRVAELFKKNVMVAIK